jgi:hypothetical protein
VAGDEEEFDAWFNSLQVAASGVSASTPSGRRSIVADSAPAKASPASTTTSSSSAPITVAATPAAGGAESSDDSEGSDTEDENERVKASGGKGSAAALAHERRKKREQDSDEDEDQQPTNSGGKHTKVKSNAHLAAPSSVKHLRQGSGGTATAPPTAAVVSTVVSGIPLTDGRLWRWDEHEDDAAHVWKQRYFVFNPRSLTLSVGTFLFHFFPLNNDLLT